MSQSYYTPPTVATQKPKLTPCKIASTVAIILIVLSVIALVSTIVVRHRRIEHPHLKLHSPQASRKEGGEAPANISKIVLLTHATCPWCKKALPDFEAASKSATKTTYEALGPIQTAQFVKDNPSLGITGFPSYVTYDLSGALMPDYIVGYKTTSQLLAIAP